MPTPVGMERLLDGRRGWAAVTGLLAVLVTVVSVQLGGVATAAPSAGPSAAVRPSAQALRLAAAATPVERDRPAVALAAASSSAPAAATPVSAAQPAPVAVAPAGATASQDLCTGPDWQRRRGEAALAQLGPAATASGFRVVFLPGRSGQMGLTHLKERYVEVFVRDCSAEPAELLRHVVGHELGHAFDTARMTDASRAAYKAARGIPASTPWYGCSGCADFATPAGDFAETFSQWLRGASTSRSTIAAPPGPAALQALGARFFTS